jgi:geranylgeranyl diphosphate synthase type I
VGVPESFAELLSQVRVEVDEALAQIWRRAELEHAGHGPAVSRPLSAARDLCLRGGKRLRAALVAVGHSVGVGHADWRPTLPLGCAVELLQAYFLIHDDWMDQDRQRRGGPAVHAALEQQGASPHQAAAGAVLAGDYTLALATRALSTARPPAGQWPIVLERFAQMQLDAVVGQKLDVLGDGSNLDEIYRLKTASYTVLGPLQLGLAFSAASHPSSAALEAFAVPVGIAFQLRDDLIGAFGDPRVTGKPRGSDLRSGKRTLLVNTALEMAEPGAARQLRSVLGNAEVEPSALSSALDVIAATGAQERVEQRIEALTAEARAGLAAANLEPRSGALLEELLVAMTQRKS